MKQKDPLLRASWWRGQDSNLRSHFRRQIYSLLVLAAHPPLQEWSPRGDSNPLTCRLQVGCATIAPLGPVGPSDISTRHLRVSLRPPGGGLDPIRHGRRHRVLGHARLDTSVIIMDTQASVKSQRTESAILHKRGTPVTPAFLHGRPRLHIYRLALLGLMPGRGNFPASQA